MKIEDGFKYAITVQFLNQEETIVAKCMSEHNATMICQYILDGSYKIPIIRIIDLEEEIVLGAYQRNVKELEKTTRLFNKGE